MDEKRGVHVQCICQYSLLGSLDIPHCHYLTFSWISGSSPQGPRLDRLDWVSELSDWERLSSSDLDTVLACGSTPPLAWACLQSTNRSHQNVLYITTYSNLAKLYLFSLMHMLILILYHNSLLIQYYIILQSQNCYFEDVVIQSQEAYTMFWAGIPCP